MNLTTPDFLTLLSVAVAAIGIALLVAAFVALRHGRIIRLVSRLVLSIAFVSVAGLIAAVGAGSIGYHALTHEDVAATVQIEPLAPQKFLATIHLPGGQTIAREVAGDEFYIDAHILKWKPVANLLGLHTAYALDRFGGRYLNLEDEQTAPRTVYGFDSDRPFDLFYLRRKYEALSPLLDAEYGSATFVSVDRPGELEVRVSTSGLLIRRISPGMPAESGTSGSQVL